MLVAFTRCRLAAVPVGALLAIAGAGCQSYERAPLDLPAHASAFLARTPDAPEVRAFADRLAASAPAQDREFNPADGVSLHEAELIALVFNADLRLARLRAGVTRATADNAGLWEDPTIGVDLVRIIQGTPDPWKVFASVGLTLPLSGRLEIEKQRAGLEHAAELARVARAEWETRAAVRRAWIELAAHEARLSTTREFLSRVEEILSVVDAMEQAGEIPRTEARLFRIEKATKSAELAAIEFEAKQAALNLRRLMGLAPDADVQFRTEGFGFAGATATDMNAADPQQRSPRMLVAMAEYEVAEKALELEIRRQYPDLQIGPGYGYEDGQDQLLLGLSLPIPILNANRQAIAQARAQREVARAEAETILEQFMASVREASLRAEALAAQRRAIEEQIVPLVDAQYADARRIAALGEVNTLVLLESLVRQQDAKVSLIEARRNEALAGVDLFELLGPVPEAAATPPTQPDATGVRQ